MITLAKLKKNNLVPISNAKQALYKALRMQIFIRIYNELF